ncbi:MAG: TonB-dependent receptor [Ignavibacteriae bacterium]|nr:TonB-dependent receptor [Ignavibacteriota bacterium]
MKTILTLISLYLICSVHLSVAQQNQDSPADTTTYYLSPVIITATQATERESPVTFSNLTQQELSERYSTQDIPVLLSELPSITYYSENGNGIGYNYINLRGFDQRRLSVMINGVPQNDPEDHNVYWIDFPDLIASTGIVQVQRGAGSAFYGPPAIGGSINLTTNPFSRKPGITLETMLGFQEFGDDERTLSLNTRKYTATINSGLIEQQYMVYGRLGKILSNGYRENSWVDFNSYFLGAVRFDKEMMTRIHIFGGPIADGLAYYGLPKFVNDNKTFRRQNLVYWEVDSTGKGYGYTQARRTQEIENFSQPHYELLNEWQLSPTTTLHNTIFYYTGDGFFDYDASWADTSLLRIGYAYGIPTSQNPTNTLVRAFVGNKQWGWLPRIEYDHGDGSLTLGAELRIHRSTHWGKIQFAEGLPTNFDPDYHFYEYNGEKDILSAYAHELYRLAENTTLMADLQLVRNRYGIKNEKYLNNTFSLPYIFVNPRVGLNYNITDEWNAYLSLAYTSREPRLRNLYAAEDSYFGATPQFKADTTGGVVKYDFGEPLAKPEHLLDLEAGAGFRNSIARLSANVFWMEFTDELVKSGQVDIFGQPVTGNAERTRHIGVELDGSFNIVEALTLSGNFSLSQNELVKHRVYLESADSAGNTIVVPTSLDGNPIAGFPNALGNVRVTYRQHPITLSVLAKYVGAFYTDNFKNEDNKNDAYTVLNAEIIYQTPEIAGTTFTLRGEVRNIFNNLYFMSGEGNAFFPAAERNYLVGITANL